jgi:SAM-dependent methyltransferase
MSISVESTTSVAADKAAQYDLISLYYDIFKADIKDDLVFYLALARETGGPVLELACGTGRLLIEFALTGFEVTGVDISPGMLACAQRKIDRQPSEVRRRIELVHTDMRQYLLSKNFGLIFIALDSWFQIERTEDRQAILTNCRQHLNPEGCLAIDTYLWETNQHKDWGDRRPDGRVLYDGSWPDPRAEDHIIQRFRSDVINPLTLHLKRTVFCDHVSPTGEVRRVTLTDNEYYVPPEKMEAELKGAGFREIEVYGGYNKEALYDPKLEGRGRQLYVARA